MVKYSVRRIYIIILLFFVWQANSLAQVKSRSKMKAYKGGISTERSIHQSIDSARHYLDLDYSKSLDYIEKGLKSSFEDKDQYAEEAGMLYEILGDIYMKLEQYDLAQKNYFLASQSLGKSGTPLLFKMVESHIKSGDYSTAKTLLSPLWNRGQSDASMLKLYEYKGDILLNENKLDSALQVFQKGLEISNNLGQDTRELLFENKIAQIYTQRGELDQAEYHLERSFSNTLDLEPQCQVEQAETNASFYRGSNELDKEVKMREISIDVLNSMVKDAAVQKELQYQNIQIADAYIEKENYNKAIPYLEKSIKPINSLSDLNLELQATKKLSVAYDKVGKYDQALKSYRKYVELTDRLYSEKEKEIEEAVILTKELVDKQKRIDGLELDRELSESKEKIYEKDKNIAVLNSKKQKLIIYGLLGGLFLALVAMFFFYKNIQQRKIANNLLALKALKSQMNPHFIFNALNSVNNYIALNDERKANKYITDFSTLMRKVLDVSEKDFITLQEELELISLYTKLEHIRFEDKFDYEIEIDDSLNADELKIPPMLIQPFVENAVWHGLRYKEEKGSLRISLSKFENNRFMISISDDGVGRERSQQLKSNNQLKKKSKGMFNVRERIKIIQDMYDQKIEFEINDLKSDGSGTKVDLIFPFFQNGK